MTTQIVASKLNGDTSLAMVETVTLAAIGFVGLWLLRRVERSREVVGATRGVAPRRRELGGAGWAVTIAGWALAILLLAPHATLLVVSLVPRNTWTTQAWPPVLTLGNYGALFSQPERLRPIVNSLWMATLATALAVGLGFAAAYSSTRRRSSWSGPLEALIAAPWALPGTVFAVALAAAFSVDAPWAGRFVLVGTLAILPLGYLVRSLPLTGRAAFAGLRQMDPALEEAAASLGAGPRPALPAHPPPAAASRSRGRSEPRVPGGPRRFRRLDRAVHLRHASHLDRDPVLVTDPGNRHGRGLWRSADQSLGGRVSGVGAPGRDLTLYAPGRVTTRGCGCAVGGPIGR